MTRPVIGIIGNFHVIGDDYRVQACGMININAVSRVVGGLPLVVPADPHVIDMPTLLDTCDGFVFTGGRPNVHPSYYGEEETEAHGTFDQCRDELVLQLLQVCVQRGQPILGICRGFQELNVAFGGTLDPEIRDLPGRMNHRMPPDGTIEEKFALRHEVNLTPGGVFANLWGKTSVVTNSLHGQGIRKPGPRIVIEGWAIDGTPEAILVRDAPGFALAVQWHPEWNAANDPVSRPLFEAFGDACRAWQCGERAAPAAKSA
ncbi:MAG: gamma-glutamyl-gamma-aminobutyrate hydrolase family protein [Rhodobacteraceae bacterium]|nr:gamma-glutamyl-gamma-aminobutyrate hydrolase family protein [Paracoccaceae bacterium]